MIRPTFISRTVLLPVLAAAAVAASGAAHATEGGASFYLLGSGGPGAGMLPPVEGLFFDNTVYYYNGNHLPRGRRLRHGRSGSDRRPRAEGRSQHPHRRHGDGERPDRSVPGGPARKPLVPPVGARHLPRRHLEGPQGGLGRVRQGRRDV